jgi:hypothetical protein
MLLLTLFHQNMLCWCTREKLMCTQQTKLACSRRTKHMCIVSCLLSVHVVMNGKASDFLEGGLQFLPRQNFAGWRPVGMLRDCHIGWGCRLSETSIYGQSRREYKVCKHELRDCCGGGVLWSRRVELAVHFASRPCALVTLPSSSNCIVPAGLQNLNPLTEPAAISLPVHSSVLDLPPPLSPPFTSSACIVPHLSVPRLGPHSPAFPCIWFLKIGRASSILVLLWILLCAWGGRGHRQVRVIFRRRAWRTVLLCTSHIS